MKKMKALKVITIIFSVIFILGGLLFLVRGIGQGINNRTPLNGINESKYIEINDSKQWISIYGENKDNPVLLYLHGGPASSTSAIDYAFTRKWADVYTVVTWDQRNAGKSYDSKRKNDLLTKSMFLEDGKQITEYLLSYLNKSKITILGHSWGSIFGANLVLEYPEYYECFIGAGQLVDDRENEIAFKEEALKWAEGDNEMLDKVSRLTPEYPDMDHFALKNEIMTKYGYNMMANGSDYNLLSTVLFNPYYSLGDWINYLNSDIGSYKEFMLSSEFNSFSLKGKNTYYVPYYNINGNKDYQTNYKLAEAYFNDVIAPYKKLFIMNNMTHGLLESDSEGFSKIIHEIREIEKNR